MIDALSTTEIPIEKAKSLLELARWQRIYLYAILWAVILRIVFGGVLGAIRIMPSDPAYETYLEYFSGILSIPGAYIVYRWVMALDLKRAVAWAVVSVICVLVGFAVIILLLVLSSKTNKKLREAGLQVGLMGLRGEGRKMLESRLSAAR
jgi:hypothetical protein